MPYAILCARAMQRLTELGHSQHVRLLQHAVDLAELHSCLREYVFYTDAKTIAFLNECRQQVQQHTVAV